MTHMEGAVPLGKLPMPTPPRVFDSDHRALSLGVMISVSLIAFEAMSVATILPVTARELGGLSGYGWAFSAFMLANLIGTIGAGQLADQRGPTRPLVFALSFFSLGLAVAGFATTWPLLIVGRTLQGFGGGGVMTIAYLSIRLGYPDELRARMLALVSSSWVLPSLLGPAVAGVVAQHSSWRWVFLGLLPLPWVTGSLMLPALRKMKVSPSQPDRRRLLFAVLLALGAGVFLYGLEIRNFSFGILVAIGLALAIPALSRLLPAGTLFARPGLPAGLAFRALLSFTFFGAEAFVPLGLATLRGLSPTQAGLVLTGASLLWVVGSWMQARMDSAAGGPRRGLRLMAGLALVVFGIAGMAIAAILPWVPIAVSVTAWALGGLGMGLAYPTSSVIVLGLAKAGEEGRVSSSLNLMESLGIAFGAGIAGAAFDFSRHAGWSSSKGLGLTYTLAIAPAVFGIVAAMRSVAKKAPAKS